MYFVWRYAIWDSPEDCQPPLRTLKKGIASLKYEIRLEKYCLGLDIHTFRKLHPVSCPCHICGICCFLFCFEIHAHFLSLAPPTLYEYLDLVHLTAHTHWAS